MIIYARSVSLYKDFPISASFMNFTNQKQSLFYQKEILKYKPKYFVTFGKKPRFDYMKGCIGKLYKKKEDVGTFSSRNPFNKKEKYNGYIYHFDYSKLPTCIK